MVLSKVVVNERWSLTRSGRYDRVDCINIYIIQVVLHFTCVSL